jgi:hypothetical protein
MRDGAGKSFLIENKTSFRFKFKTCLVKFKTCLRAYPKIPKEAIAMLLRVTFTSHKINFGICP